MEEYVIFTDSGCDLNPALLKKWGVSFCNMTFKFDGEEREHTNQDMAAASFYQKMREGGVAKTSAINPETFLGEFEEILQQGKDVLYIGFSSGLSSTYNAARVAAASLRTDYPQRRVLTVDSLSGSAGQGLLVYLTVLQQRKGATLDEAAAFVERMRFCICHWVTVDDLIYLKRGGRIGAKTAFFGNMLGLKPVLYINDEGKLVAASKARGRKKAIEYLIAKYGEMTDRISDGTVFVSHADCDTDAAFLANSLRDRYNVSVKVISAIGPVIGAHGGPGSLAIFFVGKGRNA